MADTFKVLGQTIPVAAILTDCYTVPAVTSTVISTIVVTNQVASNTTFRVSIAIAGAADTPKQYLYFDAIIAKNSTLTATLGITLATTDVVRVRSANGSVSFNIFGVEVT